MRNRIQNKMKELAVASTLLLTVGTPAVLLCAWITHIIHCFREDEWAFLIAVGHGIAIGTAVCT